MRGFPSGCSEGLKNSCWEKQERELVVGLAEFDPFGLQRIGEAKAV
jgi:hypothetical protein